MIECNGWKFWVSGWVGDDGFVVGGLVDDWLWVDGLMIDAFVVVGGGRLMIGGLGPQLMIDDRLVVGD